MEDFGVLKCFEVFWGPKIIQIGELEGSTILKFARLGPWTLWMYILYLEPWKHVQKNFLFKIIIPTRISVFRALQLSNLENFSTLKNSNLAILF